MKRLKRFLPDTISHEKTSFIPGRHITDNILFAHELIHSFKSRKRQSSSYMAVKMDISKAYDHAECSFLEKTMMQM